MTIHQIEFSDITALTGGRFGTFDTACPVCGPGRHSPATRTRKVLRIWCERPDFASYSCVRCEARGYVRDGKASPPSPERLAAIRAESDKREQASRAERLKLARYLSTRRRPPENTVVETFLRQARRYRGPIPSTIGFLPGDEKYTPTMIAVLGIPHEPEPGRLDLRPDAVIGVHLTPLLADGSAKASKAILIGNSLGSPLVLSSMNDLLGLIVCEGLETGLSLYEATGCGVWVSCGASRMPALADAVPSYTDCVTVAGEPDGGLPHAQELVERLIARGIFAELRVLAEPEARAA